MKRSITQRKEIYLLSIFILFSVLILPIYQIEHCSATGMIIYVDDDKGKPYTIIQEAIDSAKDGETIYVYSGIYYENLVINKTINLVGEDKNTTIIRGNNDGLNLIIHLSSAYVTIRGFTIQNSKDNYYCSGIVIDTANHNQIYNNTIANCEDGIVIWNNAENNSIYHNNFINNTNNAYDAGMNNQWDAGYPSGGNHWGRLYKKDIYSGIFQNISGSDGIYDTYNNIDGGNSKDNYPYADIDGWINIPPEAHSGGPYIGYVNDEIQFDGSNSYDTDGSINYLWDFGDGTTQTGEYPTHKYTTTGTYIVNLTVFDNYNVTNRDTTRVHIWELSEGERIFYPTDDSYINQKNPTQNYKSTSNLQVSNEHGSNSSDWLRYLLTKFNLSSIPSITHITSAYLYLYYYDYDKNNPAGRNLSLLRNTDNWNEENVTWNDRPSNSSEIVSNSKIPSSFGWMIWNTTSDVQDFISGKKNNYGWKIVDRDHWGEINIPVSKFKSKETETIYTPYLEITYTLPLTVYINGPIQGFVNESLSYEGLYLGMGTKPYRWKWDFGDGAISDKQNPTHIYTNTGHYTITLMLLDSKGNSSSYTTTVTIKEKNNESLNVEIKKPEKGLYVNSKKIWPLKRTLIFGYIDVEVYVLDDSYVTERVEFYLDEELKESDTSEPYVWHWNEKILFSRHKITIIAYNSVGNSTSAEVHVWKIL